MIKFIKKIRNFLLKNIKWHRYKIGSNFHAGRGVVIWGKSSIKIGDNVYIGRYSSIECDADIGNEVLISNYVQIVGRYDHNYKQIGTMIRSSSQIRDEDYDWHGINSKVIINDDVWIGVNATILSGVEIGRGAIISAGSLVTGDVKPYEVVGGNPAKKISFRFSDEEIKKHEKQLNV